jgi:acyl-CoA thioesterase
VARLLGPGDYALVDSVDNYEYLDVLAASNAPDRILTTALADQVEVANWMMGRRRYYRENRTEIVDRYLRDKFTLATVPDTDTMARAHIKYVLVRNQMFIASLDRHPHFSRRDRFNRWVLYERR